MGGDFQMHIQGLELFEDRSMTYSMNYLINLSIVSLPGILSLIFTIILTQGALNEDIRQNYELFHRSQPVSIWQRSLSKFTMGIAGNWVVLALIIAFTFIIINLILIIFGQFSFWASLSGSLQGFFIYARLGLLVGAICFFLSALFKDKAFLQGLAILVGIQFLFMILNTLLGWKLPLPLYYLYQLVKIKTVINLTNNFDTAQITALIKEGWKISVFNWKTLLQIAISGVLFFGATIIYKLKEIK